MTESNKRTVLARRNLLRFGAALAALPAALTLAGRDSRAQLSEQEMADVRRIEAYINNIGTMRARFQQVDPNLEISTGSIYLRRPGRMRVEYDPPNPILIIADGALISQVDRKLGELSQLPLGQSTAWFLLRDPIDIDDGITVNRVERGQGTVRVVMYQTDEPDNGTIELIFLDNPLLLTQWIVTDPDANEVRVGLIDVEMGIDLPASLFATPRVPTRDNGGRD